jgi:excinuclease ABC subunit A
MRAADHVIAIGPFAGELGGEVVFEGTFDALLKDTTSLTA